MGIGPVERDRLTREVAAILVDLELASYYDLLELRPDASESLVDYNYNLKLQEYGQLRDDPHASPTARRDATCLLERLTEARDVLSDAALRAEYDRGLARGELRHSAAVRQRAAPAIPASQRDEHVDRAVRGLAGKIPLAHLQSGEHEPVAPAPAPVNRAKLEELTASMRATLARQGIDLRVRDDLPLGDPASPIDAGYLAEAVQHLEHKLHRHGLDIHEAGEAEDRSAESEFAAGLVDELQAELKAMGLDVFDVAELVDSLDQEELAELREAGAMTQAPEPVPPEAPPPAPSPLDPELRVDIDRLLHPEPAPEEERFEEVIPLDDDDR